MRHDLFLSHRSTEKPAARALAEALRRLGISVWMDESEVEPHASDIGVRLREGLANCRALLALATPAWALSRACQWELTAAALAGEALGEGLAGRLILVGEVGAVPRALHGARIEAKADVEAIAARLAQIGPQRLDLAARMGNHPHYGRPRFDPDRFVGRSTELWEVHARLEGRSAAIITGRTGREGVSVRGAGGIGKTMLAREYAARFQAAWPGGVVALDGRAGLVSQLRSLLLELGRQPPPVEREEEALPALRGGLRGILKDQGRVLWLVDDLPDSEQAEDWRCPVEGGTLITTRAARHAQGALDLDALEREAARELLWRGKNPSSQEAAAGETILDAVGCHALAVDVAGALVARNGAAWLAERIADPAETDRLASTLREDLPTGTEKAIAALLRTSFDPLGDAGWAVLRLSTMLGPGPIPRRLVEAAGIQAVDQAAGELEADSLGRLVDGAFAIHAVVRRAAIVLDPAGAEAGESLAQAAEGWLLEQLEPRARDPRQHAEVAGLLEHAEALGGRGKGVGDLRLWVAVFAHCAGGYTKARTLGEALLAARRRVLGEEHPDTLNSMNNLAHTLWAQGDLAGARAMQEHVLAAHRRALGGGHTNTLASINNLALTLQAQGDLPRARALLEQQLTICHRELGEEHPHTLASMNNLAFMLRAQGDLRGARALHEQEQAICRRALGEEHPHTLTSMNNLAMTLQNLGDLPGARTLQEQVLAARRRVLGEDHPHTLVSMNNLAETLRAQGNVSEARALLEEALAGTQRMLGEQHPETLNSKNNLSLTLRAQGDLHGARTLQEQVLAARRRDLGDVHPETLASAWNLWRTTWDLGLPSPEATALLDALAARAPEGIASAQLRTVRERYLAARPSRRLRRRRR